ncbi:aryl hydrocarbon receptor repressor isoform X2 [Dasypus novemcinctus]|uniref:aryl hydrocarbon receptor repressor isoform X2 n=1 Tax=Dasypus novemcinctus TaxID=9361 RepID=UPI00265FC4C1|nr:aryl hydrocarbon receptor repressor isoform X2 [Dasypus novemcinctus]
MIPPGECMYAGRKRRKPVQKQRPAAGSERSNPSKRHRDRLNAELDHLASLLPFPPDIISKLDKLSVLRLSVSYLRVKSFFQAVQEPCPRLPARDSSPGDGRACRGSAVLEGRLLLESLDGFALVVSAEGMIFYASATIVDYLGFHQTDVMHQNIYDYIHVDDRQDFCRQLHWAMDPPQVAFGQPLRSETEDAILGRLLKAQEGGMGPPTEYSAFLTRCFVCRVRCLLDSTSGFLTMQFQGKLKFLFGQKKKAPSGTALPPRLSLFCVAVPVLLPSVVEMKMKSSLLRGRHRADVAVDSKAKPTPGLGDPELHGKPSHLAGRSNGETRVSVFRVQAEPGRGVPGVSDLAVEPEGEEEPRRMLGGSSGVRVQKETHLYDCPFETQGQTKHLAWTTGKQDQDGGARLKLEPRDSGPFSGRAQPRGACMPYPGVQGTFNASGVPPFRNPSSAHPLSHSPGTYSSRTSRPLRSGDPGQAHPPTTCPFPPPPRAQRFAVGGYSTESAKLQSVPVPLGAPAHPVLSLDVPIKVENDSGSEGTADGYFVAAHPLCLGAGDEAGRQPVGLASRMHLKTEPDHPTPLPLCAGPRHPTFAPHFGHRVLGAHPHSRAASRSSRELAPFYPASRGCLEHVHGLPESGPAHCLWVRGHDPRQPYPLRYDCRAPGAAPMVKREPLDSPPWAAHSQSGVSGPFPKSALATVMPPRASECSFLP